MRAEGGSLSHGVSNGADHHKKAAPDLAQGRWREVPREREDPQFHAR